MTTITTRRIRAGRPVPDDFAPRRFLELDGDHRVSHDEQHDYQIPVGEPAAWMVILLGLSPLLVIGLVSLVAVAIQH